MPFRKILVSAICGYTSYIEYNRQYPAASRLVKSFTLGSADGLIMNTLETGDLVLFSRRWYHYHIPMAVAISLYKFIHNSDFDHCGVVVNDPVTGVAHIYELSPFSTKPSYREFEARILYSQAHHIVTIPLSFELNAEDRLKVNAYVKEGPGSVGPSECVGMISGSIATALSRLLPGAIQSNNGLCPSSNALVKFYEQMGLKLLPSTENSEITCRTFFERKVTFLRSTDAPCGGQGEEVKVLENQKIVKYLDSNIVIRMK